jgi:hypothetical protein
MIIGWADATIYTLKQGALMRRCLPSACLVLVGFHALIAASASAHPASGIVVDAGGDVFFVHTGKGVGKIDSQGKLTYIHQATGGHFLALDPAGSFSRAADNRLFQKLTASGVKGVLLFASGGAPLVVSQDGNLYYGSGFPEGDDLTPGGLTLTRMSPDGKRTLFAPGLKAELAKLNEAVTGLATGPDGSLFVACPNAILNVKLDGTMTTLVRPVMVPGRDDAFAWESDAPFFHAPYLRGLDVARDATVYAAVTGCRCVIKIMPAGKVETILKSERPWTPTGVALDEKKNLFVLEYDHIDKPKGWAPRVRKLGPDGKVTVLATFGADGKQIQP